MIQPAEIASTLISAEAEKAWWQGVDLRCSKISGSAESLFRKSGNLCDSPHRNDPASGANCCSILRGNVMQVTLLS